MKNGSFLSLLLVALFIDASFCYVLVAEQKLFTITLKNNSVVDIIKLASEDSKDRDTFACGKELWMKTFLEAYKEYTAEQLYLENKPGYLRNLIEAGFVGEDHDFNTKKKDTIFVVARDVQSNEIIGFSAYDILGTSENRTIYIRQLAVDSAYRKQGLGKALILDMMVIIAQDLPAIVTVCTRKINEPAISFYHKLNFQDASMKDVHPELPEYKFCGFKLYLNGD